MRRIPPAASARLELLACWRLGNGRPRSGRVPVGRRPPRRDQRRGADRCRRRATVATRLGAARVPSGLPAPAPAAPATRRPPRRSRRPSRLQHRRPSAQPAAARAPRGRCGALRFRRGSRGSPRRRADGRGCRGVAATRPSASEIALLHLVAAHLTPLSICRRLEPRLVDRLPRDRAAEVAERGADLVELEPRRARASPAPRAGARAARRGPRAGCRSRSRASTVSASPVAGDGQLGRRARRVSRRRRSRSIDSLWAIR